MMSEERRMVLGAWRSVRGSSERGSLYGALRSIRAFLRGAASDACAAQQQRIEQGREATPVGGADDVLLVAQLAVPRMADRGDDDVVLDRPREVLGAVVDQQLDAELDAAADLVVRAVQVVVRQADLLQPAGRRVPRVRVAMARDVDEVPSLAPAADGLDRVRIGLAGQGRGV